jgi:hypothetical protein
MSKRFPRELTEIETTYLEELDLYKKVLNVTTQVSINQHGIETDGRGMRAMKLFTRQTLIGLSLTKLLPKPSVSKHIEYELWDICSIASLTRNLLEGYLSLYYFGLEKISEIEAELRFYILQLHRNVEWYNIRKLYDLSEEEINQFEEGILEQNNRVKNHPYFLNLTSTQKNRILQGAEMYITKYDFEKKLPICKDLRRNYKHLSNLVHPLPLSIERVDNVRGRGIGSEPDINYSLISLMIARRYLAATTIGIADLFPDNLAKRFSKELERIRPLENKGFTD